MDLITGMRVVSIGLLVKLMHWGPGKGIVISYDI